MAKNKAKNTSIVVDGVSWDAIQVNNHKSEAEFLKAMQDKTYGHLYEGPGREASLKEVYKLAQAKKSAPAKETVK
jgi:hypothetical protein